MGKPGNERGTGVSRKRPTEKDNETKRRCVAACVSRYRARIPLSKQISDSALLIHGGDAPHLLCVSQFLFSDARFEAGQV
jgi:hypothetical protein